MTRIFHSPDAVSRRRTENDGCDYLSNWQVHSADITAQAITSVAHGLQEGPIYVPMPVGAGKTTGAIWGINDVLQQLPDHKVCFLTPYTEAVDRVYKELADRLGEEVVGYHYRGAPMFKHEALSKQVVVLTHAFLGHNTPKLSDRDLFVVDEALYSTGEASLTREEVFKAISWATSNGVFSSDFEALGDYANAWGRQSRDGDNKFTVAPEGQDLTWAQQIVDLDLNGYSQSIEDRSLLDGTQWFCEALLKGQAFLDRGNIDKTSYNPTFSAALLGVPKPDKTIILTATGGMLYELAGPFKQDLGTQTNWTPPSYERLKLVQLSGPNINGHYRTWGTDKNIALVTGYVDWLLSEIPEQSVYLTMPNQVVEKCMRGYLGQPATGELSFPIITTKHGKTVYVSNHARSVGSNEFRDCEAVIYLWDNHLPQSVSIQRFHTLNGKPITQKDLEDANGGQLSGAYKKVRKAQYVENIMQHIGRGRMRTIDANGLAGTMTAYILCKPSTFISLQVQHKGCSTEKLEYNKIEVKETKDRLARIINYIREHSGGRNLIPAKELAQILGFKLSRYRNELLEDWDLKALEYEYHPGGKGKGNSACFKKLTD